MELLVAALPAQQFDALANNSWIAKSFGTRAEPFPAQSIFDPTRRGGIEIASGKSQRRRVVCGQQHANGRMPRGGRRSSPLRIQQMTVSRKPNGCSTAPTGQA